MYGKFKTHLEQNLESIKESGLYKEERVLITPQGTTVKTTAGKEVIVFCSNNYLGLSSHPNVIAAAHKGLDERGYGMSSVRFIAGTQDIHKELEKKIAEFLHQDDTILYGSCFDANGGVFETLLTEEDAVISDELNHASIIDGIRLCKAERLRYKNRDMADLETQLQSAAGKRFRLIVIDGIFSMDGFVAPLDEICTLAEKYDALVMVDESHATGVIGATGRGTIELKDVMARVDIISGTLGKALGGAMGGFITGKAEIIALLRQRSRPYLFSNSLPPSVVSASIAVLDMIGNNTELRDALESNVSYFKDGIKKAGFDIKDGEGAIIPIMLYEAKKSQDMARMLLDEGIYVVGFFYPVVPKDQARIRVQISAAHTKEQIDTCIAAFTKVGAELGII